ncbi:tetratricopeptide repeat protein [Haloferula sp.]|uniref:tetratricopeptide repeat protein n=1 Tax=Haloferula sp. TaxID=2497595 RepID=UPI003C726AE5
MARTLAREWVGANLDFEGGMERFFLELGRTAIIVLPMRMKMGLLALLATGSLAMAEEEEKVVVPGVDAVISELLEGFPAPEAPPVGKGVVMAVTTSDKSVQEDIQRGLACVHAGWDLEGYRHFCEALKKDPDCLMAHFGVVVSLMQADLEMADEKQAAFDRMLALAEEGVGSDLEQRYVFGLVKLLQEGPGEAASAFGSTVEQYPNDPQAVLFKSLLGRGGYDDTGDATPDQLRAEEELLKTVEKNPDVPYLLYGLLAIRAEAPILKPELPMARKLVSMAPDFPPYQHLLGHYEWRCGNHDLAQAAFGRAADLYAAWMKSIDVPAARCPGWTKAVCYRAVAFSSKGDYKRALEIADEVGKIEVTPELASTDGGRLLLWEAKTLTVRILMRRSAAGDLSRALKTLPTIEEAAEYGNNSLAVWSYQAYSSALAGRISLELGNIDDAREVSEDISKLGGRFVQTRELAAGAGERSHWLRSFKAMEVLASELRGLTAMAGPADGIGSAFNWYQAAADRQKLASLMMPPAILIPMELRLGEYYMARRDWTTAIEVMIAGQHRWPNDWELLHQLQIAFHKAGMKADAEDVERRLKKLKAD